MVIYSYPRPPPPLRDEPPPLDPLERELLPELRTEPEELRDLELGRDMVRDRVEELPRTFELRLVRPLLFIERTRPLELEDRIELLFLL